MQTLKTTSAEARLTLGDWLLGHRPGTGDLYDRAQKAARRECPVLLCGETGTGKEVWANLIHQSGPRAKRPFVPVNCAALTVTLAESQLFGHERGAFTGATGSSLGVFRAAEGGVVFLDEVGEMPLELQPKLLRVLQEHEVTPVGGSSPVTVDVQVIAATNRDLKAETSEGGFREDLYFRLNMLELRLPPLRQRLDELPAFVEVLSEKYARQYNRPLWRADAKTMRRFSEYDWPGNLRELAHVIEQSYVLDCAPTLPDDPPSSRAAGPLPYLNLAQLRAEAMRQALARTRGHKGRAAKLLGVHANTVTRMLRKSAPPDLPPERQGKTDRQRPLW